MMNNTTGYLEILPTTVEGKKPFTANVYVNNKNIVVGYFNTPQEAAMARDAFIEEYKLPCKLNFPEGFWT